MCRPTPVIHYSFSILNQIVIVGSHNQKVEEMHLKFSIWVFSCKLRGRQGASRQQTSGSPQADRVRGITCHASYLHCLSPTNNHHLKSLNFFDSMGYLSWVILLFGTSVSPSQQWTSSCALPILGSDAPLSQRWTVSHSFSTF